MSDISPRLRAADVQRAQHCEGVGGRARGRVRVCVRACMCARARARRLRSRRAGWGGARRAGRGGAGQPCRRCRSRLGVVAGALGSWRELSRELSRSPSLPSWAACLCWPWTRGGRFPWAGLVEALEAAADAEHKPAGAVRGSQPPCRGSHA